jgi:hypothetical protein
LMFGKRALKSKWSSQLTHAQLPESRPAAASMKLPVHTPINLTPFCAAKRRNDIDSLSIGSSARKSPSITAMKASRPVTTRSSVTDEARGYSLAPPLRVSIP